MFKNYLLLSLKVLKRKPFYTFISLFGISFTLTVLMLLTSMGDAMLGSNQPMSDMDRMVFLNNVERFTPFFDTIPVVDSVVLASGAMRYDTTFETESAGRMMNNSSGSFHFFDNNLRNLEKVESYSFFNANGSMETYLDGRKVSLTTNYVDADYFRVFDFSFLHGVPFGEAAIKQGDRVAVITDKGALEYFGNASEAVIGQEMTVGYDRFRIVGVVAQPLAEHYAIRDDVMLPFTTINEKALASTGMGGGFVAVFKASSAAERSSVIDQLAFYAEQFKMPPGSEFERLSLPGKTFLQDFAMDIVGYDDNPERAVWIMFGPLVILLLLFLMLPLLNLVNLNISRVFERRSEIAVRKAFGADSRDILYQFILENIVMTLIGGILGLVLAAVLIWYINDNDLLGITRLAFSPKVFLYFLGLTLLFGLLSGLLPAYRMSRTNIANSLR